MIWMVFFPRFSTGKRIVASPIEMIVVRTKVSRIVAMMMITEIHPLLLRQRFEMIMGMTAKPRNPASTPRSLMVENTTIWVGFN